MTLRSRIRKNARGYVTDQELGRTPPNNTLFTKQALQYQKHFQEKTT